MKLISILIISIISTTTTHASDWQIGAGIYYANISGVNAYAASGNSNTQQTNNLTVPSFFIAKSFNNKFNLVFRHTTYDELISNGVSSDANIFNEPNLIFPSVVTPYRIKEKMYEGSFAFNYGFLDNDHWKFEAGPTLSITKSKADLFLITNLVGSQNTQNNITESLNILRKFTKINYTLGAEANIMYKLSDKINININYRYASPSEKRIHLIGASVSFKF